MEVDLLIKEQMSETFKNLIKIEDLVIYDLDRLSVHVRDFHTVPRISYLCTIVILVFQKRRACRVLAAKFVYKKYKFT